MNLSSSFIYICLLWSLAAVNLASANLRTARNTSQPVLEEVQLQRHALDTRIIGGTTASPGQYPFFVSWGGCGASLIHSDIILCAAHCNVQTGNTVYVGAYKPQSTANGAVMRTITTRRPHPSYNSNTQLYDFLVMKLDSPVSQTPVVINSNVNNPTTNQVLTVIGMGDTTPTGDPSSTLEQVNVNYVDKQSCANVYGSGVNNGVTLCAGVSQGGKDGCQGDSGGPILDSSNRQVGITSFGHGCGDKGYPGVYSRTSGVASWISQQVCALSSSPPSSCFTASVVTIRVDIRYDNKPGQTSWSITNPYGAVRATSSGSGVAGKVKSTYVKLDKGTYVFIIRDTGNNGICCANGSGNFSIYANYNGRLRRVAYGNGQFKSSQQVVFVV